MKKMIIMTFLLIFLFCDAKAFSQTISFSFIDIPDEGAFDIYSNFSGVVSECGTDCILFNISNNGPVNSFIGQVYFDDIDGSPLLSGGTFSIADSVGLTSLGGVFFQINTNLNLPQGNNISFDADFGFGADKPGSGKQGVDIGETAGFLFSGNYDDVVTAMINEDIRIGIHVQGIFPDSIDGSDSYVNTSPVPLPATLLLLGTGLIGLGGLKRRFTNCYPIVGCNNIHFRK